MDQLSEKYYSTSPFAYVANNPVSGFDVDGRMFNDDGTIDTSGTANGFVRNRSFRTQDFGQRPGEGGGGGMTIGQLLDAIQGKSNPGDVDFSQFDFTKYGTGEIKGSDNLNDLEPTQGSFFDEKGKELFNHWLEGSGKDLKFVYDKGWSDYMKKNTTLNNFLYNRAKSESEYMRMDGRTKYYDATDTRHFEIDNGYTTGYGMLHGTQYFSYVVNGRYDKITSSYIFKFKLKWADRINANKNVWLDNVFNSYYRNTSDPKDYNITIIWNQTIVIKNK